MSTDTAVLPMNQDQTYPPLRVGLAQFKPAKADLIRNLDRIKGILKQESNALDVLVFPETTLSGYFLEGGVAEAAVTIEGLTDSLGEPPQNAPDLVLGFYERGRRNFYNSVAYIEAGEGEWCVRHVHRKIFLPTYGVFDEARFVEPGKDVRAFDTRFGRIGMLICEEAWHSLPAMILALDGAEVILVMSASPARDFAPSPGGLPSNLDRWDRIAPVIAMEHGIFVAVAQLAGSEGGKLFPGGSVVVGPDGSVLARGPLMDEAITRASLEASAINRVRISSPLLSNLKQALPHLQVSLDRVSRRDAYGKTPEEAEADNDDTWPNLMGGGDTLSDHEGLHDPSALEIDHDLVERTLVEFIRDEVQRRRGFNKVVIGVSGGVDSAVSLFLACKALGKENVHGFRLPYRESSKESLEHGELLLEATGVHAHTIDISDPLDRYVEKYEEGLSPLRKGNLMARLRAIILFDQSAKLGALPLGTGNKSERLLGYFTWHADDSPPINPLGDLFKTQVWGLARHLGIPGVIIDKPATADLVQGVTDEDEIGVSYQEADPILHWLLHEYRPEALVRMGFSKGAVDLVQRRLQSTHWKRELPTVAVLSSSAIGEFYLRPVDF